MGGTQQRAYMPGIGVLGYRPNEGDGWKADFFANDSESLEEARLDVEQREEGISYIGEVEIPERTLEERLREVASTKEVMDAAKSAYDESLRKLLCTVEYLPRIGKITGGE
jgi:hypothetical protein